MNSCKVLLIGLHPDSVDYLKWPQLTPEKLETAFEDAREELRNVGYHAEWCLTDTGESAEAQLTKKLETMQPDIAVVGAGVRTDSDHLFLFEKILNILHTKAPSSKIAFNTSPFDTVEAVKRWA